MPLLRKVAPKDPSGRPCTARLGPGGSGHYIKMIHNGIEQGTISAIAEAWDILNSGLGLNYEEVADIFAAWAKTDGLQDCFQLEIGVEVCRKKDAHGASVLEEVRDTRR
jgi:6-phosphogluconate dehydrogenase